MKKISISLALPTFSDAKAVCAKAKAVGPALRAKANEKADERAIKRVLERFAVLKQFSDAELIQELNNRGYNLGNTKAKAQ